MHITSIGIDIGKTRFHLVAPNEQGSLVMRRKSSRKALVACTANIASTLIRLEDHCTICLTGSCDCGHCVERWNMA